MSTGSVVKKGVTQGPILGPFYFLFMEITWQKVIDNVNSDLSTVGHTLVKYQYYLYNTKCYACKC